ncbi:FAD binding domain-containing protein [Chachezhania antarctica]|uniref:FAD binding domain-containing protein n=1 Tax=Chachezhania antarctica TaxID=2340860 RepID=UPI000EB3F327|nr:FAD binding domain-containing protein [Chachezhania antarctica]
MKPAPFAYYRPATLEDAAARLADGADEGAMILAGGQSLVPMMALRVAYPSELIDLNTVPGLDTPRVEGNTLVIPALVRHATFHTPDPAFGPTGDLMASVVRHIAHHPIRQRGTFCGSLAHADPSSEWALTATTLGAELELLSVRGTRRIPIADWIDGAMSTTREPDEILTAAHLPLIPPGSLSGFYEVSRRAGDFALGMALVVLGMDGDRIGEASIGLGGIEEIPRRIPEAEAALQGQPATPESFATAAQAAMDAVDPMSDATTPASYRRDLAGTVIRRALAQAATRLPAPV